MTFNDNARFGSSGARRSGAGVAVAGGGIAGIGAIAVLLFSLFTGTDLTGLIGGGTSTGTSDQGSEVTGCDTGADANASTDCRLADGSIVINQYWATQVDGYTQPQLILVQGSTSTPCGTASNQTGPFYCPTDKTVYIDPTFFDVLQQQFGDTAGPLAQLYVLAHEYGHHVQDVIGIFDQHPNDGQTGPDSVSVRTELQADCFAGAWVGNASEPTDAGGTAYLQAPTQQQISDALAAAAAVGDDHIQQQSGGSVNSESWTHGSSEQRQRWFEAGLNGGPNACDTFSVSAGQL